MKKLHLSLLVVGAFLALGWGAKPVMADNAVVAGTRVHMEAPSDSDLPYGDGDMSYFIGYEYHDTAAFWQLGVDIAPDISSRELPIPNSTDLTTGEKQYYEDTTAEYVITPQINLVFKDGIFRGGVGAFMSYISRSGVLYEDKAASSEWSALNWQFILGISTPLFKKCTLDAYSYFPFETLSDVGNFGLGDLEYGAMFSYHF